MRIVCPDCAATYDVPDNRLVPGRPVRCAQCSREWHPAQEPDLAAARAEQVEPAEWAGPPATTATTQLATAVIERPETSAAGMNRVHVEGFGAVSEPVPETASPTRAAAASARYAWAGSLLLLVVLAWAAYTWRSPIMQAWPPSERVYAALGLT